jgi:predicted phosphodiesterase
MSTRQDSDSDLIRWLHLSDFHVGKDNYGQRSLFRYILRHVQEQQQHGNAPDLVFITGDISNRGKQDEFSLFVTQFLHPLGETLGNNWHGRIYVVPGNHDVDRDKAKAVRRYGVLTEIPVFLDPTPQGLEERSALLSRFESFSISGLPPDAGAWLNAPQGAFTDVLTIKGHPIGIVGINTAWLSEGSADRLQLTPGKSIVEAALDVVVGAEVKIVLGHHPIDWFLEADAPAIRALLARNGAVYLHGHLHKGHASHQEGAGHPFLTLQTGAAFQAREAEIWLNGFISGTLDFRGRTVNVQPYQWSKDDQEWKLNGSAFPERFRKGDLWVFPFPGYLGQGMAASMEGADNSLHRKEEVPPTHATAEPPSLTVRRAGMATGGNPFQYGGAVAPEHFYGRNSQRADVQNRIGAISAQCMSLIGFRRSGKSSLLRYIHDRIYEFCDADQQPLVIALDLQNAHLRSPSGILDALRRGIQERTKREPWAQQYNDDPWVVEDGLRAVRDAGWRLILLIDEFEQLGTKLEEFQGWGDDWRAKASAGYFAMVIATFRPLDNVYQAYGLTSPFGNLFTTTFLGPLVEEEWTQLVYEGFARTGKRVAGPEFEWLDDLSGGHPFYVQMAASLLWQHGDPDRAHAAFEQQSSPHLISLWNALRSNERSALKYAVGARGAKWPIDATTRLLKDYGLLRPDGRLFSSVFASVVRGQR